jgi:hypothetical protein
MTTNVSGSPSAPGSAKIYTFPARGRFAVSSQPEASELAADIQLPAGAKIASGAAWYHDEAIQAEQRRKN